MSHKLRQNLTTIIIVVFVVVVSVWGNKIGIPFDRIELFVKELGVWGPIVYIGILLLPIIFAPTPAAPFMLIGAKLFSWQAGMLYGLIGFTLGNSINFWIGRYFGKPLFKKVYSLDKFENLEKRVPESIEFWGIVALRLLPNPSFDFFSYFAGFGRMKYSKFALASLIGMIPAAFLWNFFGDKLLEYQFSMKGLALAMGLVVIIVLVLIIRKKDWWKKIVEALPVK